MKQLLAPLLAASVALGGCATEPPRTLAGISPEIADPVLDGSLLLAVRVVADERPIELRGEFSPEGRAAFEDARSARIASRPRAGRDLTGSDIGECLVKGLVIFCPVVLALRGAALGTVNGVRRINATVREAPLLIPEKQAYSLGAMFKEHATGRGLGERASRFTMPRVPTNGAQAEPRLVVRMKAVETFESRRNWLGIRIVAEAQAFPSAGAAFEPTDHVYTWWHGPLSGWTRENDDLVRQALNDALEALGASIASTYARSWELPCASEACVSDR